jgi:hypothetical protein
MIGDSGSKVRSPSRASRFMLPTMVQRALGLEGISSKFGRSHLLHFDAILPCLSPRLSLIAAEHSAAVDFRLGIKRE